MREEKELPLIFILTILPSCYFFLYEIQKIVLTLSHLESHWVYLVKNGDSSISWIQKGVYQCR
jgi:hypothetical protein